MPKRKTGAAKKKAKLRERQKEIREYGAAERFLDLEIVPCNMEMECDTCGRQQKNRAFCYFCDAMPKRPQCVHCGRFKCMQSDCLPGCKHPGQSVTGNQFVGAVCDFCEGWVCHSRRCIVNHSCPCPLEGAECMECQRGVANNGGRFFRCATCRGWLCQDDQFEHQAMCQALDAETYQCRSCNRLGSWACLVCKVTFCDDHVKSPAVHWDAKNGPPPCKRCRQTCHAVSDLSVSTRSHDFGRQSIADVMAAQDAGIGASRAGYYGEF